jgi:hypothetical protein
MKASAITKIENEAISIAIRNNPPAVDIFDERQVPEAFMVTPEPAPPPQPRPDKAAIKAALAAGTDVPGARLTQGTRLEIKP